MGTEDTSIDGSIAYQLREKVAELEAALLAILPTMPIILKDIHTHLRADPELVTVLSDEEVGHILRGLKIQTNTQIAAKVLKSSSGSTANKAKLAQTTIDDL